MVYETKYKIVLTKDIKSATIYSTFLWNIHVTLNGLIFMHSYLQTISQICYVCVHVSKYMKFKLYTLHYNILHTSQMNLLFKCWMKWER